MEIDKVIGILIAIVLIIIISYLIICCLGFGKIFKIYPKENKNIVSV